MAVIEGVENVTTDLIDQIMPALLDRLGPFVTIFKAAGVVVLIYFIYLIVKAIKGWSHRSRVKRIEKKVDEIDRKLDELLKKKGEKGKKKKK